MNLNLVKRSNIDCPDEFREAVTEKTGLSPVMAELLFSRGIDTLAKVERFLNADSSGFYDPYLLKGMREAVERLNSAIENGEKIIVYGDYDCDGVCAAAILSLYLSKQGLDIFTHIPSRTGEGYGLSIISLEMIIESQCPDLILTCDCGISANKEVEFCQDLGVDIIITDHHEVSSRIPECIVINPKQSDCPYPIDTLCGAGVALKLVEALGGRETALEYADLAAVATVADLVPLLDENRLIVQTGLFSAGIKNPGLKALLKNQQLEGSVTSGDIAFKIAPRINAAGRMGDAYRAFELLVSDSSARIHEIIEEINGDNQRRKALSDTIFDEALEIIKRDDITDARAIIVSHPSWEKGITGILAAKLSGIFKRPSFILVSSGDCYKGTARSIEGVNLYELLTDCQDVLLEFGGHSQAAGFSIETDKIPLFKERVLAYLKKFDDSCFMPVLNYDLEIDSKEIDLEFAKAISRLEPFGNSNPRPIFKIRETALSVSLLKNSPQHTSVTAGSGLSMLAFNFTSENQFLMGNAPKDIAVEVQTGSYNNRENVKAVVKGVSPSKLYINDETARANFLKTIALGKKTEPKYKTYKKSELNDVADCGLYGTLVIAGCEKSYAALDETFLNKFVMHEFMFATEKNNYSRIIVSPVFDNSITLESYSKIIFLDTPPNKNLVSFLAGKTDAEIYLPESSNESEFTKELDLSRKTFGAYFDTVRKNQNVSGDSIFTYFKKLRKLNPGINLLQLTACICVFNELGFISVSRGAFEITVNAGVTKALDESSVYAYFTRMQSDGGNEKGGAL